MSSDSFGSQLRAARERSGEDLMSVARKLRIRPDILAAIENSDLENMPPRGYSRNMLNAYARYLGLNPTDIVKEYLDAQYASQVAQARAKTSAQNFNMDSRSSRSPREARSSANQTVASSRGRVTSRPPRDTATPSQTRSHGGTSFDEGLFDDIDPSQQSRPLTSAERAVASRPGATHRAGAVQVDSYNAYGQGLSRRTSAQRTESSVTRRLDAIDDRQASRTSQRPRASQGGRTTQGGRTSQGGRTTQGGYASQGSRSVRPARRSTLPEEHSISAIAAPRNLPRQSSSKMPFIIAGAAILVLVVLIALLTSMLGRSSATETSDSDPISITGLPDSGTTSTDEDATDEDAEEEEEAVAPTSTTVEFSIEDGHSAYIEVYVDDVCVVIDTLEGPTSESYEVTGTLRFIASPPTYVTLTQDGEEVELEATNGVADVTIDFQDVLDAWNEAQAAAEEESSDDESDSDS